MERYSSRSPWQHSSDFFWAWTRECWEFRGSVQKVLRSATMPVQLYLMLHFLTSDCKAKSLQPSREIVSNMATPSAEMRTFAESTLGFCTFLHFFACVGQVKYQEKIV